MEELLYRAIPEAPGQTTAAAVLVRLVDAVGFRYRWATEGLRPAECAFRPGPESMTLLTLLQHVFNLAARCEQTFCGSQAKPAEQSDDLGALRRQTLERLWSLRTRLASMSEDSLLKVQLRDLPFWNVINGPLADALTHVGQINAWRRLAGNPAFKVNHMQGKPPAEA